MTSQGSVVKGKDLFQQTQRKNMSSLYNVVPVPGPLINLTFEKRIDISGSNIHSLVDWLIFTG
jgi:hypothetical protein